MYTDNLGAQYYKEIGITDLWDEGINVEILENTQIKTNYNIFWASGRVLALGYEKAPCILMDTDMIVWDDISHLICSNFMCIHKESLEFQVYVPKEKLHTPPGYKWDDWDWTTTPCNAALMYFGDNILKNFYVEKAIHYIDNNLLEKEEFGGMAVHAVFSEQRLLPMCAKKLGVKVKYFLDGVDGKRLSDGTKNTLFTHIWVYKQFLKKFPLERKKVCLRLIKRIIKDFSEYEERLYKIPNIKNYLKEI